jgi:L-2,4-diaminobutyric acid acetyltransferase
MSSETSIRSPQAQDAAALWQLVDGCPELDSNSFYTYWLLCTHFPSTCAIAESDGSVVGFVTAFISPIDADVCFIWQLYVAPPFRRAGVTGALFAHLLAAQPAPPRFVEATITPDNLASHRSFQALATRLGAALVEADCLAADDFPHLAGAHDPENRIRIGPLY